MKTIRKHWLKVCSVLACLVAAMAILLVVQNSIADEVPQPVIAITTTNTTNYIKITNGVSFANYELYRRATFNSSDIWGLHTVGAQGQTNFTAEMGLLSQSYYFIGVGSDWDQDGITNAFDGDPINTNVGILSITIDSPTNGTVFN